MVIIYGKPGCSFCLRAKKLCQSQSINFKYFVLGVDITVPELEKLTGCTLKTVPQIFVDNKHVGGYTEFAKLMKGYSHGV